VASFRIEAKPMTRKILLVAMVIVLICIPEFLYQSMRVWPESFRYGRAIHESHGFVHGCWSYRERTPGRKFPAKLSELLLRSPEGVGPFMDTRDDTCDDPWGNPYKYALVPNENGELEPYVWAERIENGKAKLYGAKCSADGTVTQFGRLDSK